MTLAAANLLFILAALFAHPSGHALAHSIATWSPLPGGFARMSADRSAFEMLRRSPAIGFTGAATIYYLMGTTDLDKLTRLRLIREWRQRYGAGPLMSLEPLSEWGLGNAAVASPGA
jgi:hypothetical protein